MIIDQNEFASAASSAGIETVEAFGGEGQTEVPENLRRIVHRLSVRVRYKFTERTSSPQTETVEIVALIQTFAA
jgi:hypothetical protein